MKTIDCYYRFEKLDSTKSKTRFDLVYNSDIYEPVHNPNAQGKVFIYYGYNSNIRMRNRKEVLTITSRNRHLTTVFFPDISRPDLAQGDYGTDAILMIISDRVIELLIFKDKKNSLPVLFNLLFDGELNAEIEAYRKQIETLKLVVNN